MAEKTVILVPLSGTIVIRDDKRVRPVIGKPFGYTEDEVTDLKRAGAKFRKPENEVVAEPATATETGKKSGKKAKTDAAKDDDAKEATAKDDDAAAKPADKDDDL